MGSYIENETKKFIERIKKLAATNELIIYGAGVRGKTLFSWLEKYDIRIKKFCVSFCDEQEERFLHEIPVLGIDEVLRAEQSKLFFLLAARPQIKLEMKKLLTAQGVSNYIDIPDHLWEIIADGTVFRPTLEITPKIGCKINCRYCPQDILIKRYFETETKAEMKFDTFKVCVDKTPEDLMIDFSGFVEPFLACDTIRMIQYANSIGRDIRVFTTLMGLDIKSVKEIENIPFKQVVLHLPDQYQYANIPMTSEYLALLDYVLSIKKKDGELLVDAATCQAQPPSEILDLIGNRISVSWELIDRAGNLNNKEGNLKQGKNVRGTSYCCRSDKLNHNVLLPNGDVVLCCMDFGLRHRLGNLIRQSYEEIHCSESIKKIKDSFKCGGKNTLCATCTALREYDIKKGSV